LNEKRQASCLNYSSKIESLEVVICNQLIIS
jgi:hypothetical protein